MDILNIHHLTALKDENDFSELTTRLNTCEKHSLQFTPWSEVPYKPVVSFSIAHQVSHIYIKFFVAEKEIRAVNSKINGSVWEDSCVEFFISFDEMGYYNLEFNCIGTPLVGFGKNKTVRNLLPIESIRKIRISSFIYTKDTDEVNWELTVAIPASVFLHHPGILFKERTCRANFYKCGDLLSVPHFVTWSNIESTDPNFHLPEFFGTAVFE